MCVRTLRGGSQVCDDERRDAQPRSRPPQVPSQLHCHENPGRVFVVRGMFVDRGLPSMLHHLAMLSW